MDTAVSPLWFCLAPYCNPYFNGSCFTSVYRALCPSYAKRSAVLSSLAHPLSFFSCFFCKQTNKQTHSHSHSHSHSFFPLFIMFPSSSIVICLDLSLWWVISISTSVWLSIPPLLPSIEMRMYHMLQSISAHFDELHMNVLSFHLRLFAEIYIAVQINDADSAGWPSIIFTHY